MGQEGGPGEGRKQCFHLGVSRGPSWVLGQRDPLGQRLGCRGRWREGRGPGGGELLRANYLGAWLGGSLAGCQAGAGRSWGELGGGTRRA